MIHYFEYSNHMVESGRVPAPLCCVVGRMKKSDRFSVLAMAERVYQIEGNELTEIKNRSSVCGTMYISDEDKVVLRLKAVLI